MKKNIMPQIAEELKTNLKNWYKIKDFKNKILILKDNKVICELSPINFFVVYNFINNKDDFLLLLFKKLFEVGESWYSHGSLTFPPIMSLRKYWKWYKRFILNKWLEEIERKGIIYNFDTLIEDFFYLQSHEWCSKLKIKSNWYDIPLIWLPIGKYSETIKKEFKEKYFI